MIGKVISGRYEIIEKLGEGGMANVYKAKCKILKRFISIKVLKQELTNDNDFVRKFKDEAMEVAKLSNNNIVSVYDIGTEGNIHYIVMEYINGKTLKNYINDSGSLSVKVALDFSIQICNALEVAHDVDLIHRDVKSQNILVSNSGVIKVTDFGIAKSSDSATITNSGKILGSAYYISPEQAKGNFVDSRSDIYSFGVVMYEMFTGKLPFTHGTPVNVALQHIQVQPIEPIELNSKLPMGVNNLIIKCLQKNPILRYQSIKEIKSDLIRLQSNKNFVISKCNIDTTMVMETVNSNSVLEQSKVKKSNLMKSIMVLLASFIVVSFSFFLFGNTFGIFSKDIEVPLTVGKLGVQYKRELESLGLKYELSGYVESELEKDFVVDTYPRVGSSLKKGDTVKVVLSGGAEKIRVPDLINKTLNEANIILKNNGLKIGKIEERFSDVYSSGRIMIQTPNYNSDIEREQSIDIVISKGAETTFVNVPKFIDLTVVEAKNLASLNGVLIKLNSVVTGDKSKHEKIFDQSIPENIEIKPSVTVELSYYEYDESFENSKNEIVDEKIENLKENNSSEEILDDKVIKDMDQEEVLPENEKNDEDLESYSDDEMELN